MRYIHLSEDAGFNEREQLKALMGQAPERGYTTDQVRLCIKVLDKLDAGGVLKLEDAEWAHVKERLQATQWRVALRGIPAFTDKIMSAKELREIDNAADSGAAAGQRTGT